MAKAGWYKDPKNKDFVRYFDGNQWTANVKPLIQKTTSENISSVGVINYSKPNYSFDEVPDLKLSSFEPSKNLVEALRTYPLRWPTNKADHKTIVEELAGKIEELQNSSISQLEAAKSSVEAISIKCKGIVNGYHDDLNRWNKIAQIRGLKGAEEQVNKTRRELANLDAEWESRNSDLKRNFEESLSTLEVKFADRNRELIYEEERAQKELNELYGKVLRARETAELQDLGIFNYNNPAESSVKLKGKLDKVILKYKEIARNKNAVKTNGGFTFNNSAAQGKKFEQDFANLMLASYNAEVENAIVKAQRGKDLDAALNRIEKARERVKKLGTMLSLEVNYEYHRLRLDEIELAFQHKSALEAEREEEKARREEVREAEKVEKELQKAREAILEKERDALKELQAREKEIAEEKSRMEAQAQAFRIQGLAKEADQLAYTISHLSEDDPKLTELKLRVNEVESEKTTNGTLIANNRAGYVYVISNKGSFGESIVKIGLTRRAVPEDRVKELGGASVPFRFGVHVIHYSGDAVKLETDLHRHFAKQAVNKVNSRKEFFRVTPEEVMNAMSQLSNGTVVSFDLNPVVDEYARTLIIESEAISN